MLWDVTAHFHPRYYSSGVARPHLCQEALNQFLSWGNNYNSKRMVAGPSVPDVCPHRPYLCWRGSQSVRGISCAASSRPVRLFQGAEQQHWACRSSPSRGTVLERPSTVWQRLPFLCSSAKKSKLFSCYQINWSRHRPSGQGQNRKGESEVDYYSKCWRCSFPAACDLAACVLY